MKVWTYLEAKTKILKDLALQDELFISADELAGKFNDALTEAEAELITTNGEYLLTNCYIPLVTGTEKYQLPWNIYANKIRGIMYSNGSIIYPVMKYRRMWKFENQMYTEQYGAADPYMYTLINDYPGQAEFQIRPSARETAIFPPSASSFVPMIMWYYRNCVRVPMIGEFCNPEVLASTQFNTSTNVITTNNGTTTVGILSQGQVGAFPGSVTLVTGDAVKFYAGPTGTLPSGLTSGTTYYVIKLTATTIKVATTLANALAGTAVSLVSTGTVSTTMWVAATTAIVDATILDIPEFTTYVFSHVKAATMDKDTDPRYGAAVEERERQKKLMVDTLTEAIPDDDDTVEADYSSYQEMS